MASLPHGHVAAVVTAARRLGFPELLGPPGRLRDLAFALLVARGFGWVTALRAPDVAALAAADGPLQFSLFDQANLAEITHPDYPDERLVACRAFTAAVDVVRDKFGLTDLVLVGDRGMITSARIAALRELGGFRGLLDPPGHPHPQHPALPRAPRRPHRRAARRPHSHPTARLPAPRHRRPAPAHVDTTTPSAWPIPLVSGDDSRQDHGTSG